FNMSLYKGVNYLWRIIMKKSSLIAFITLLFFAFSPPALYASNLIKVDLGNLTWRAFDHNGVLVKQGRVSGGKNYCPDVKRQCRTVTGTFTVYSKRGAGCKSSKYPVG